MAEPVQQVTPAPVGDVSTKELEPIKEDVAEPVQSTVTPQAVQQSVTEPYDPVIEQFRSPHRNDVVSYDYLGDEYSYEVSDKSAVTIGLETLRQNAFDGLLTPQRIDTEVSDPTDTDVKAWMRKTVPDAPLRLQMELLKEPNVQNASDRLGAIQLEQENAADLARLGGKGIGMVIGASLLSPTTVLGGVFAAGRGLGAVNSASRMKRLVDGGVIGVTEGAISGSLMNQYKYAYTEDDLLMEIMLSGALGAGFGAATSRKVTTLQDKVIKANDDEFVKDAKDIASGKEPEKFLPIEGGIIARTGDGVSRDTEGTLQQVQDFKTTDAWKSLRDTTVQRISNKTRTLWGKAVSMENDVVDNVVGRLLSGSLSGRTGISAAHERQVFSDGFKEPIREVAEAREAFVRNSNTSFWEQSRRIEVEDDFNLRVYNAVTQGVQDVSAEVNAAADGLRRLMKRVREVFEEHTGIKLPDNIEYLPRLMSATKMSQAITKHGQDNVRKLLADMYRPAFKDAPEC